MFLSSANSAFFAAFMLYAGFVDNELLDWRDLMDLALVVLVFDFVVVFIVSSFVRYFLD